MVISKVAHIKRIAALAFLLIITVVCLPGALIIYKTQHVGDLELITPNAAAVVAEEELVGTSTEDEPFVLADLCPVTDGPCAENAAVPSPRTLFSARTKRQFDQWFTLAATLRAELNARLASVEPPLDVIFWGDSIFEAFRGTSYGEPTERALGNPAVFQRHFAASSVAIQAISGDQTQHALWRLTAQAAAAQRTAGRWAKVGVLLIGTNNLGAGMSATDATAGILAAAALAAAHHGAIVLCTLLPRGERRGGVVGKATVAKVRAVNDALRRSELGGSLGGDAAPGSTAPGAVIVSECGALLEVEEGSGVPNQRWMPDLLHPNALGCEKWLACLAKDVETALLAVK